MPLSDVPLDDAPLDDARSGTPLADAYRLLEGETLRDLLDREKILAPAHALARPTAATKNKATSRFDRPTSRL